VSFAGIPHFVVGANLPWVGYGTDIGASAWHPAGGLSAQPDALALLDRTFAALAADGITVVRTFLLCDARSGVRFDGGGTPIGVDDCVFPDMDVLLAAARRYRVGLIPVLLDFHLCAPRRVAGGVQLGGRSRLVADPDARRALVDLVLRPIFRRYGADDTIVAWDVMNEPEWCVARGPIPRRRRLPLDTVQRFLAQTIQCVRESAGQPVTVGCAGTLWLDLVRPLDVDFHQMHWYERFGWTALERRVIDLGLGDRPVILGEFPGRSGNVARVLDAAKTAGYGGALVWSVLGEDDESAYPADMVEWAGRQ
jgi:hypothetical protein